MNVCALQMLSNFQPCGSGTLKVVTKTKKETSRRNCMKNASGSVDDANKKQSRKPYKTPEIIYKGKISTRAGSPLSVSPLSGSTVADPADLFGDD